MHVKKNWHCINSLKCFYVYQTCTTIYSSSACNCTPSAFVSEDSDCQAIPQRISLAGLFWQPRCLFAEEERKTPCRGTGYGAHIHTNRYRHAQMSACSQSRTQIIICTVVHMRAYTHTHAHVHTYIHTHSRTHTHTHSPALVSDSAAGLAAGVLAVSVTWTKFHSAI